VDARIDERMLHDIRQHSVDLGCKGLSKTGLLVVVPGSGVGDLGLGFRPKDKAGRHAPPASFRRTSRNGRARIRDVFRQAAIQFHLLLRREDEFGLALGLGEALPQGKGYLNALAGGKLEKLGKSVR
jgi:hypothetical protein